MATTMALKSSQSYQPSQEVSLNNKGGRKSYLCGTPCQLGLSARVDEALRTVRHAAVPPRPGHLVPVGNSHAERRTATDETHHDQLASNSEVCKLVRELADRSFCCVSRQVKTMSGGIALPSSYFLGIPVGCLRVSASSPKNRMFS